MSSRVFLFFPPRGHEPPPTPRDRINPPLSLYRRRFPILRYAKCSDIALYAIDPLFHLPTPSSPHCTLKVSEIIRFGNRVLLIRMSVPAHKSLLVRNIVSMLSHRVISRAWLKQVIRWCGLLRCAPMMRSKTRWCTVRSLAIECSWRRAHVLHPYRRASIASAFTIRVLRESATFGWS